MIDINAIRYAFPAAEVSISGDSITWHNQEAPSDAEIAQAITDYATRKAVLDQINLLESAITIRRLREGALGIDGGWLAGQETLIAAEREKLT